MDIKGKIPLLVGQERQIKPRTRRNDREISVSFSMNKDKEVRILPLVPGTFRQAVRILLIGFPILKQLNETTVPHVIINCFRNCLDLIGIVVYVLHGHTFIGWLPLVQSGNFEPRHSVEEAIERFWATLTSMFSLFNVSWNSRPDCHLRRLCRLAELGMSCT